MARSIKRINLRTIQDDIATELQKNPYQLPSITLNKIHSEKISDGTKEHNLSVDLVSVCLFYETNDKNIFLHLLKYIIQALKSCQYIHFLGINKITKLINDSHSPLFHAIKYKAVPKNSSLYIFNFGERQVVSDFLDYQYEFDESEPSPLDKFPNEEFLVEIGTSRSSCMESPAVTYKFCKMALWDVLQRNVRGSQLLFQFPHIKKGTDDLSCEMDSSHLVILFQLISWGLAGQRGVWHNFLTKGPIYDPRIFLLIEMFMRFPVDNL